MLNAGLVHVPCPARFSFDDCLDVVSIASSASSTAVAGSVLVATKDPAISDENTDRIAAPRIPATSVVTSAASCGL